MKLDTLTLNGDWQLTRLSNAETLQASVPGNVHQALLAADKIPDPYFGENERELLWIGEENWQYQRSFQLEATQLEAEDVRLCCKGLDTFAAIEINGTEVGVTNNMFREWSFEVGSLLCEGENVITVTFSSVFPYIQEKSKQYDMRTPKSIEHEPRGRSWVRKEQCNFGWDWGPVLVTHGIWQDIELQFGSRNRLEGLSLQQRHAEGRVTLSGEVTWAGEVDADADLVITLRKDGEILQEKTQSAADASFAFEIADPELWWPNNMGEQPLYDLELCCGDTVLKRKIGLRTVELVQDEDEWGRSFYFRINGVPMFAKGSNWIPADTLHREDEDHYRDLLQSAVDGNQNMIRVWGGAIYERDVFYDLCDELGLLVWQDLMFACSAYPAGEPGFKENIEEEVKDQARRLAHHASIALWCGNNELEMFIMGKDGERWPKMPEELYLEMFDEWLPQALATVAPDAIYWPSSPHSPDGDRHFHSNPDCGDAHLWEVWHGQEPFEWYRGAFHRFCSEFGFQSYPEMKTLETFTRKEDLNVTSPVMEFHQRSSCGNTRIIQYMLSWFRMPEGFESTVMLSQLQQGLAIKYAVEHWRLNRPRCMGALYWQLNDCWPVASWASIDYYGRWKTLHYMSKRFFAPLMVAGVENPEDGSVTVHVASDLTESQELQLKCTVTDTEGRELAAYSQDITAAPLESRLVQTLDCAELIASYGERKLLIWLELWQGEHCVSENLVHFVKPKHLELKNPQVSHSITQTGDSEFVVSLRSDLPALWVTLNLNETDFRATDNAVNLRPGEPRSLHVRTLTPLTTDAFAAQLQLTSITDYSNYQ